MVPGLPLLMLHALQHNGGGTVPHLSPRNVLVLNGNDGVVRVPGQVMDHHLTMTAELRRNALCDLA